MKEAEYIFMGGNIEDKLLKRVARKVRRLGVATLASTSEGSRQETFDHLQWLMYRSGVDVEHIDEDCISNGEFRRVLERVDGVFFSGGDQSRQIFQDVKKSVLYMRRAMRFIGGTSAGAALAGPYMSSGDDILPGLGFLQRLNLDQHFSQRHRMDRLQNVVRQTGISAIGIDENTAIGVSGGKIEVLGNGNIYVVNASNNQEGNKSLRDKQVRPQNTISLESCRQRN